MSEEKAGDKAASLPAAERNKERRGEASKDLSTAADHHRARTDSSSTYIHSSGYVSSSDNQNMRIGSNSDKQAAMTENGLLSADEGLGNDERASRSASKYRNDSRHPNRDGSDVRPAGNMSDHDQLNNSNSRHSGGLHTQNQQQQHQKRGTPSTEGDRKGCVHDNDKDNESSQQQSHRSANNISSRSRQNSLEELQQQQRGTAHSSYSERERKERSRRTSEAVTDRRPDRLMKGEGRHYSPSSHHHQQQHEERNVYSNVSAANVGSNHKSTRSVSPNKPRIGEQTVASGAAAVELTNDTRRQQHHLDPNTAATAASVARTTARNCGGNSNSSSSRRRLESMLRNDSLSSDPSDCTRPPPPRPHKHKVNKRLRQFSLSSSEDDLPTTSECTSCEEQEIESESISERGIGNERTRLID